MHDGNLQDDQFHCISKRDIEEGAESGAQPVCNRLCCEGEQSCQRDDGDCIESENDIGVDSGEVDCNTSRDEDE